MKILQNIYKGMGLVSQWSGKIVSYVVLALIVSITFEVMMRYVFNAPTNWSFSLSYMMGGAISAVGLAYVFLYKTNVRVDVFYSRFSPKGKLVVDIIFTCIFFFPLFFMLAWVFGKDALYSFSIHETATESTWYPILWPYKTVLALGFSLAFLQGIANFIKDVLALAKGGEEPW